MASDLRGGPRAWRFLKRNPDYIAAWRACPAASAPPPPPFRAQTEADLDAAEWGLLAWHDPLVDDGLESPFWAIAPMLQAAPVRPGDSTLAEMAAEDGAELAGPHLRDGRLVLKIEQDGCALQMVIADGEGFDAELDGLALDQPVFLDPALDPVWPPQF